MLKFVPSTNLVFEASERHLKLNCVKEIFDNLNRNPHVATLVAMFDLKSARPGGKQNVMAGCVDCDKLKGQAR